jgi:hypothetical protein
MKGSAVRVRSEAWLHSVDSDTPGRYDAGTRANTRANSGREARTATETHW